MPETKIQIKLSVQIGTTVYEISDDEIAKPGTDAKALAKQQLQYIVTQLENAISPCFLEHNNH